MTPRCKVRSLHCNTWMHRTKRNNFSQNPTLLSDAAVPDIDSFNRQRSDSYQVSKHRLGNCRWLHNPHLHLHSTCGWRMKAIIAECHEGQIHFHTELLTLQSSRCVSPHSLWLLLPSHIFRISKASKFYLSHCCPCYSMATCRHLQRPYTRTRLRTVQYSSLPPKPERSRKNNLHNLST